MDEFPRRAFFALVGASAGAASLWDGGPSSASGRGGQSDGDGASSDGATVVTTRAELEAAFENLSPGDTIRITDENAPYRTTQWLDVDVDGATVVGPGVRRLIQPADGAAVGGIRIGHHERCREIDVRGIGFRGTRGQGNAERLHAIAVRNASNVTIERNYVRGTYPIRHGDGGSGISVTRDCSNVRIVGNEIHEFGDRGVQLAGRRLLVANNVISEGLDRPIACDLWYPDEENRTAQHVSIFGNVLGDSYEGSLVGVARNEPVDSSAGNVSIFGNVGFGSHKAFCHVRGPIPLADVSIQNNVSRQETDDLRTDRTKDFSGVEVSVSQARNVAIKNNELYGYSKHAVFVDSDASNLTVQNNGLFSPARAGIRLQGATNALVSGNLVTDTGGVGIRLFRTANVVARGNYVRRAGTAAVLVDGGDGPTGNDVSDNYVTENNQSPGEGRVFPAILVRDGGVRVRGNVVRQNRASAIVGARAADGNVYEGNWADGDDPWRFASPTARTRANTPPVDVHRGASADGDGVVAVEFDRPYARLPGLAFGRRGGGVRDVSYRTDGDGNYVGAEIAVGNDGGTLDVFVDEG